MTTAAKMYQLLWLKAFNDGEVRVQLPSRQHAARLRMALYNAAQPVKKRPNTNPELAHAVEHCLVNLQDADCTVVIMRKDATTVGAAVLQALGMSAEEVMTNAEARAVSFVPATGEDATVLGSLAANSELAGLIEREGLRG